MATQKQLNDARTVYGAFCRVLDGNGWQYVRDDNKLTVALTVKGKDLPMEIFAGIDAARMLISIYSKPGFTVPEEKMVDMAVAVAASNWGMVDGSFDYSLSDGNLIFRMAASYRDSMIGDELLSYMLGVVCGTVDRYNDRFLMLCKGTLSLGDFLAEERT